MIIKFWGCRGSLPYSVNNQLVRRKIFDSIKAAKNREFNSDNDINNFIDELPFAVRGTYGCNTSCVEIIHGEENVILDAGSGIRDLANSFLNSGKINGGEKEKTFHIFLSHLHWDHILGFPFFIPAYIPGVKINFYGCHKNIEEEFIVQQNPPHFPVPLKYMKSDIRFHVLEEGKEYDIAGFKVTPKMQNHPGVSYGYKFLAGDKKFVYSTDAEHQQDIEGGEYPFVEFFKDADLLVIDAQYSHIDAIDTKLNWGHSSNITAVELAHRANVKRMALFHSEHTFDDYQISEFLEKTRKYSELHTGENKNGLEIFTAYEGLEVEL